MQELQPAVKKIIKDIKALKIQGARNVARAALKAIAIEVKSSRAKTLESLHDEIVETGEALALSRPTEPMLRNSINNVARFAMAQIRLKKARNVAQVKKLIVAKEEELAKKFESDLGKLAEYGARLIPNGSTIMTHCHSSSTTAIFKRAKDMGKDFSVIACETRPLYQGRVTANELVGHGIKTTLIVDGAANLFMKKIDMVVVGADSVTSRGDLINKIGTSMIAHIARLHDVSFYSAAELYKYSPITFFGQLEKVEERDAKEVWDKPPKKLEIRNPAFEATSAQYIRAYITEMGIIPPQTLFTIASEKLGIKIYE
jgi:ribose 1,5-bisphosphate isomerase